MSHATLSASASERWINCPGSVKLCEGLKSLESKAAAEGTAAHKLSELCFKHNCEPSIFIAKNQKLYGEFRATKEMAENVLIYLNYVRANSKGKKLSIEKRFSLEWLHAGMFGTNDACIMEDFGIVEIVDLKFGAGKLVEVDHNPQLLYYALGAMYDEKARTIDESFEGVKTTIVQPRAEHPSGEVIRSYTYTVNEMIEFSKFLKAKAMETEKPNAPIVEGNWCQFCPGKVKCPIKKGQAKDDFAMIETPSTEIITPEMVSKVLTNKKRITDFIKACEDFALSQLASGQKIEGLKLVRGRGSRRWNGSDDEVIQALTQAGFSESVLTETKLKSVAQMEKSIGKKSIEGLTTTSLGSITIAPESDKREAVLPAADEFNHITGENDHDD